MFVLFVAATLLLRALGQPWAAAIATLPMVILHFAAIVVVLSVLGA